MGTTRKLRTLQLKYKGKWPMVYPGTGSHKSGNGWLEIEEVRL
jgi:hypothetical protein